MHELAVSHGKARPKINKKLQTSKEWNKNQQQTNKQANGKNPKLSKTRWQKKTNNNN